MTENLISVIDLANQYGVRKQTLFKILKRLGIETRKRVGDTKTNRGQAIAYITNADAQSLVGEIHPKRNSKESTRGDPDSVLAEKGVFYLLLLEPDHDPGRFKVGFAASLPERLRSLRCSAPLAKVIATWPCKTLWEKTAIDCVTEDCQRLHTEVFRTQSIDAVRAKCQRFFELMPKLQ
jgi:hypothetical protein